MLRNRTLELACCFALSTISSRLVAQQPEMRPPQYRGVMSRMDGVFVTPVTGAPFSALVKLESTQALPDGTSQAQRSIATIARDSQGRIYNEQRSFVPVTSTETPEVRSSHIFDPDTRISTFLNPYSHMARQRTIPPNPQANSVPGRNAPASNPFFKQDDLRLETMEGFTVRGDRQTSTIPATVTGTGKNIVVVDEYWYSEDLHMNLLTRHNDPRTGVQVVTITQISRNEPDQAMFQVPSGYKVVDENPPN